MAAIVRANQLASTTEQTGDRQTLAMQRVMRDAQRAINSRGPSPVSPAAVTFTAGQQVSINHGLGRVPLEWAVSDVTGGYGVFQRISWDDKVVTIQSQNACTARFKFQ